MVPNHLGVHMGIYAEQVLPRIVNVVGAPKLLAADTVGIAASP